MTLTYLSTVVRRVKACTDFEALDENFAGALEDHVEAGIDFEALVEEELEEVDEDRASIDFAAMHENQCLHPLGRHKGSH